MILNSNNIEKWFFDYFEGELTVLERKEVEQFVLNNPEYQADFKSWSDAYTTSNYTAIPVYVAPASLYAKIAFYETTSFRIVTSIVTIFTLSTLGIWSFGKLNVRSAELTANNYEQESYDKTVFQRLSFNYLAQLNDSDETDALKIRVHSKNNPSNVTNDTLQAQNNSLKLAAPNVINTSDYKDYNDFTDGNINNEFGSLDFELNQPEIETSYLSNDNKITKVLLLKVSKIKNESSSSKNIHKNDNYYLKFISKRNEYKFLDFRNSSVKGVSTLIKDDRTKSTNVAEISESEQKRTHSNSSSSGSTKKSFADKLKNIDLGLMNINDPIFEIANYQLLTLNPSLSGQLGFSRLKSQYRNLWLGSDQNIQLAGISFDSYINKLKAGFLINANSFLFNKDAKASSVSFAYSQKFEISKEQSIAATIEYTLSNLTTSQPFTQNFEIIPGSITSASRLNELSRKDVWHNLGVSSFLNGKYFYGGVNVTNILGNSISSNENSSFISQLNYSVQLGTDYKKSFYSNFVIAPYIVFNKFGDRNECWFGTSIRYKGLIAGLTASTALSSKVFIGVQSSKFRFVYGYDLNKTNFQIGNYKGNHEVSFRILLGSKYNNWSR